MEERQMDSTKLDPRPTTYVFCCGCCTPGRQSNAGSIPTPTGASEVILRLPGTVCSKPATGGAHIKSRKRYRPSWTPTPSSTNAAAEDAINDDPGSPESSGDTVSHHDYARLAWTKGPSHDATICSAKVGRETGVEQRQRRQQQQQSLPEDAGHDGAEDIRPMSSHQPVRVVVHEVLSEDFGLFTWPSAIVLACLVWSRREEFRGASVVEIGAGTALPGLLAAKLGAHVILTDRGKAPWVLENIRGAVAANGLTPASALTAISVSTLAYTEDVGGMVTDSKHMEADDSYAGTEEGVYHGKGRLEAGGLRHTGDVSGRGHSADGSCCVHELSWGEVTPATMELAKARPTPKFILGADVFYSSEHFDDVLATVYMLLTAAEEAGNSSAFQELSESSKDQVAGRDDAAFDEKTNLSFESKHAAATAAGVTRNGEPQSRAVLTDDDTRSRARGGGRPNDPTQNVFLTAYHERSARRSLRPLLRKWGMEARVLRDAPRRVLPDDLWEDGRFDSIALIEIALQR